MAISQNLVIIIIIGLSITYINAEECQVKDSICECTYKDGSGFSLKTLLNPKDSSIQAITDHNLTYFFNPCENSISLPSYNDTTGNACDKGYMLCVYNKDYKNFTLLGNKDDAAFGERNGKMYMSFGKIPVDNQSTVLLECTPNAKEASVLYAPLQSTMTDVHLTLYSKLSCSDQIIVIEKPSVVGTFFLILFIMFLCYLVIGMLYKYFFVGARGMEILPNYDFWSKLWISIKLGFLYLKNGCKVIPAEESYDAI